MKFKVIYNIFILFFIFLLFSIRLSLAADGCVSAFQRANVYYEQGNFDEAIKQYEGILKSGLESGSLYYNLGSCYFKKGEMGRAILNYEKSRRLIPLDKELESNYEYARSLIKSQAVASQRSFPMRALNNLFDKFSVDGLTILISALYLLILVGVLMGFFFSPFKKHALIISVFMGLFFIAGFVGLKGKITLLNKEGIVTIEQVDAKFEPMDKATAYFTLYEGMKVEVISSKDNWYKIKRHDNKSGWVEKNALAIF